MSTTPIRRALLSVSDKTGIIEFARELRGHGVEILSTGGTARVLREAGIDILEVEKFTGFREMLDGRVKTLQPKVHAGILFRRDDPSHVQQLESCDYVPIDLVVVNLYPFEETVARDGVSWEEAVEQIDIGGPAMVRSAAKNHADVTIVCDPRFYEDVVSQMREYEGATTLGLRKRLATEAFLRTASYDRAISSYFVSHAGNEPSGDASAESALPQTLELSIPRSSVLRYGENPHQQAAIYGSYLDRFEKLHGRDLSYNNLLDFSSALEIASRLGRRAPAAVAIIKHSNPCGAAIGATVAETWRDALATDAQSASGGIIAVSREVDDDAAQAMSGHFIEVLVAPGFSRGALEILTQKKNRILLVAKDGDRLPRADDLVLRTLPEGVLVQTADAAELVDDELRVVTERAPSDDELTAMKFAWDVVRSVKSNAIVYASSTQTLGIGAGQMSRVDSSRIAVLKAQDAGLDLRGSVVASDAFFPFADGLVAAAEAGATAAIQPGGSVRDQEVIDAANERGVAMVFTGRRHFRH